ncbi:Sua5/YciO/YrdC/YwlC family protein [Alteromonas lipotrueiana]|uniref:Sua5/YciO/YrdC/YwlC family protein n=1 Tax=Alteromonas lipotrueiana TaxID=2803815 RepID=UPI001C4680C9|nr:Sua5/YciO/YrdC/YwlC family protein [Alteromonas lipotrueiana]
MQDNTSTDPIANAFTSGQLLVYPTEAVMGLGCDPDNEDAVGQLLKLKQRPAAKGLILLADNYSRLLPYVNDNAIGQDRRYAIFSSWPDGITWLLPKSSSAPVWITGSHSKIAVRVTSHPVVKHLCEKFGKPLVSTSANPAGANPALTTAQAQAYFGDTVTYIPGEVAGQARPSSIRDGESGQIIRE